MRMRVESRNVSTWKEWKRRRAGKYTDIPGKYIHVGKNTDALGKYIHAGKNTDTHGKITEPHDHEMREYSRTDEKNRNTRRGNARAQFNTHSTRFNMHARCFTCTSSV